jgi:pilus assembly protein Flp/PilA
MNRMIKQFLSEEDGVAAIEYGLLAGLIAVAIIATVTTLGGRLNTVFTYVSTALNTVVNPAG